MDNLNFIMKFRFGKGLKVEKSYSSKSKIKIVDNDKKCVTNLVKRCIISVVSFVKLHSVKL